MTLLCFWPLVWASKGPRRDVETEAMESEYRLNPGKIEDSGTEYTIDTFVTVILCMSMI